MITMVENTFLWQRNDDLITWDGGMQQHLWEKQTTDCAVSCPRLPPSASATSLSLFKIFNQNLGIYRVSQKTHFQNAAGPTVHWLNHQWPTPLVSGNRFIGRFSLKLSQIKPSQVMYMVKLGPTVLNFGYDFFLLVPFFGTPCSSSWFHFHFSRF